MLQAHNSFSQILSLWLECKELGKQELLPELTSLPHKLEIEPFAALSIATLRFAEQIYSRIALGQLLQDPVRIWILCEYANCQQRLRASNVFGTADIDGKGRLKGKTAYHDFNMKRIEAFKLILRRGDLLAIEEYSKVFCQLDNQDPSYNLVGRLVSEAIKNAIDTDDDLLIPHIQQYLETWSSHLTLVKESEAYQITYLVSPHEEPRLTEKNRRMAQPKGFTPKRPRGRPPKGN